MKIEIQNRLSTKTQYESPDVCVSRLLTQKSYLVEISAFIIEDYVEDGLQDYESDGFY